MDRRQFCKGARREKKKLQSRLNHATCPKQINALTRKIEMLNIMIQEFDPRINDQRGAARRKRPWKYKVTTCNENTKHQTPH